MCTQDKGKITYIICTCLLSFNDADANFNRCKVGVFFTINATKTLIYNYFKDNDAQQAISFS